MPHVMGFDDGINVIHERVIGGTIASAVRPLDDGRLIGHWLLLVLRMRVAKYIARLARISELPDSSAQDGKP